jgi:hypothetical protein
MKAVCHYSIVRFEPFVETGEFANVGVVLFAPAARYFCFKLLVNRYARVTNFFEQLDARVFLAAMRTFREEMQRVGDMLKPMGTDRRLKVLNKDAALGVWSEVIRPRETMIRFSDSRLVMAEDVKVKLQELFAFYVERNFATREYQEQVLERGVRGLLREAQLQNRFFQSRVGNDEYHAQFPFVELDGERPTKIIKPLNLAYRDASRIIDHGGQWAVRVNALRRRNLLPERVLFAVDGPSDMSARGKAKQEVVAELEDLGVIVRPYSERQSIIEFAKAG